MLNLATVIRLDFSLQREDSRVGTGSKWEREGAKRNGSRGSSRH